jgi:hypothetical protein
MEACAIETFLRKATTPRLCMTTGSGDSDERLFCSTWYNQRPRREVLATEVIRLWAAATFLTEQHEATDRQMRAATAAPKSPSLPLSSYRREYGHHSPARCELHV